jgi:hypothetical protein
MQRAMPGVGAYTPPPGGEGGAVASAFTPADVG